MADHRRVIEDTMVANIATFTCKATGSSVRAVIQDIVKYKRGSELLELGPLESAPLLARLRPQGS